MAQKREESDGTDHLTRVKRDHAEGETFIWIPASALVVRDPFVSTVCSGCLNTEQSTGTIRLQHCSKCKFLKYCSRGCQTRDWKRCHKDECDMLEAVWQSCPNQDTTFTRLFVRNSLDTNNYLKASGKPSIACFLSERRLDQRTETFLAMFHQPQYCRELFNTWKPILEALERHHATNIGKFGGFMHTMIKLIWGSLPMFGSDSRYSKQPIAYCVFLPKNMYNPVCNPNAVFVPVIDPVQGPVVHLRALRPLLTGEIILCAVADNLLISPVNLKSEGTLVFDRGAFAAAGTLFIGPRAEMMCMNCGGGLDVRIPKEEGSLEALESIRSLQLRCGQSGSVFTSRRICDLLIEKVAELTKRSLSLADQSENQLIVKADELNDLITSLRPMVAGTSFALGILYRELADVYERLGRMDKCVEAYKFLIPIVEKHLHKYDQNIFDGLSRVIVYHLEREETAKSLPYIEVAWERLQSIPGKDSFDYLVVDKLRNAVRNEAGFSFTKFCKSKTNRPSPVAKVHASLLTDFSKFSTHLTIN